MAIMYIYLEQRSRESPDLQVCHDEVDWTEIYIINQNIHVGHHTYCSRDHNPYFSLNSFTFNTVILEKFPYLILL